MDEEPDGQYELVGPSVVKPPAPPPARLKSKSIITPAYSSTNFIADDETFELSSPIWLKVQLFAGILMFLISLILTVLVIIANNTPTHKNH